MIIAACSTSKKASAPAATAPAQPSTPATTSFYIKPLKGVPEPGEKELTAIQGQYKEATIEQLKQGHVLYTQGACVDCHNAKNIYRYPEAEWKGIMDEMAKKAKISDTEKDAVYKYVLAVKATEPK